MDCLGKCRYCIGFWSFSFSKNHFWNWIRFYFECPLLSFPNLFVKLMHGINLMLGKNGFFHTWIFCIVWIMRAELTFDLVDNVSVIFFRTTKCLQETRFVLGLVCHSCFRLWFDRDEKKKTGNNYKLHPKQCRCITETRIRYGKEMTVSYELLIEHIKRLSYLRMAHQGANNKKLYASFDEGMKLVDILFLR